MILRFYVRVIFLCRIAERVLSPGFEMMLLETCDIRNRNGRTGVSSQGERWSEMGPRQVVWPAVILSMVTMSGCRVDTNRQGDNENVKVATPFGGVQVKTNGAMNVEGIGLPVYPGAELVKKRDKDNGSA